MCAVETRRGCGWRKIGGLYLVAGGHAVPCDRFPLQLTVCPTCSQGIKQSRGWTWIDPNTLFNGVHKHCKDQFACPLCMDPAAMGKSGLLWVGERFYRTPRHFLNEVMSMGLSRRISAVPRGFEVGKTWVLVAHPHAVDCGACRGIGKITNSENLDYEKCKICEGKGGLPAIFYVCRPQRIEKILPESQRDSVEAQNLAKRGITPVYVPDDDPDHQGTAYDDEEEE